MPGRMLRRVEAHQKPIYQVAFNQVDESLSSVFATVGSNWVSIYSLNPEAGSAEGADSNDDPSEGSRIVAKIKSTKKGKRRRGGMREQLAEGVVSLLQSYVDDDSDERFYSCDWGVLESDGEPGVPSDRTAFLAVAGEQRQIKVINCCTGKVHSVLQGHGAVIFEIRFHPTRPSLLLSGSADESVRLWHVLTRECVAVFSGAEGHRDAVLSLDIRLDGTLFASSGTDGCVKVPCPPEHLTLT